MESRGWLGVACAVLAVGSLTACSGDAPPPTPSASTTTSASPSPPPSPSAAPTSVAPTTPSAASPTRTIAPPPAVFGSLAEAIAAYLAENDREFSGACEEADLDRDLGKVCYSVVEDRATEAVVIIGETFSEFDTYLLVGRQVGGWLVVDSAEVPYPDDDGTLPF